MRSTHANREMLPGIGAAVLLAFTGSGATAADWRYCYAAVSYPTSHRGGQKQGDKGERLSEREREYDSMYQCRSQRY